MVCLDVTLQVLGIVAGVLLQDHDTRHAEFQQLPYHRIFIMLFLELNTPEPILEAINYQVLTAFCHTLHILRPAKAPGFAYAWLELVSHRVFIGRMLAITPQQKVRLYASYKNVSSSSVNFLRLWQYSWDHYGLCQANSNHNWSTEMGSVHIVFVPWNGGLKFDLKKVGQGVPNLKALLWHVQ